MSEFKVVTFKIRNEEYALDIMKIDSIVEIEEITKIPQAPTFVEGIMDFRGTVVPVISGTRKFTVSSPSEKKQRDDNKKSNRAIIVNTKGEKIAILVDEVKEVLSLSQENLEEPPKEVSSENNKYISAIADINGRMIIVLDVEKILTEKETIDLSKIKTA